MYVNKACASVLTIDLINIDCPGESSSQDACGVSRHSLPMQSCLGRLSRFLGVLDFFAEELLEVLRDHLWRAFLHDRPDLGIEADTAKAGQAPHPGQEHIDNEPLDVSVCAPG